MPRSCTLDVSATSTGYPSPRPIGPLGDGVGSLVTAATRRNDPRQAAAERQGLQEAMRGVEHVRDWFAGLGVEADEGTGPGLRVMFDPSVANATYDAGRDLMTIGVDPVSHRSYGGARDVIAHEYAHRVINQMTGMVWSGEDAVVHETVADTFAAAYDGDWQLGEDLGHVVRDIARPGRQGDPETLGQVRPGVRDPHRLAGVPNRAAALIGNRIGLDAMAQVYVTALRDHVRPGGRVSGLALGTLRAAHELHGRSSPQHVAVAQAWDAVGVLDAVLAADR